MIVAKFGGTSVADASALRQVDSVVESLLREHNPEGLVVVLSATSGTTSQLLDIARNAGSGRPYRDELDALVTRHRNIATELVGSPDCVAALVTSCREFADAVAVLGEWNDATLDAFSAYGELLSTAIFHSFRQASGHASMLVDARALIVTDDRHQQANVDDVATAAACRTVLASHTKVGSVVITQGFIAASHSGATTTLGRGGSDYSAAIIGSCLDAQQILIYTDVSGVYSCDPRLVAEASPLPVLSFDEMRDMASYGAKVLHPATIAPAVRARVPVHVLNTFRPAESGTIINASVPAESRMHAVSILRNVRTFSVPRDVGSLLTGNESIGPDIVLAITAANRHTICLHNVSPQMSALLDAMTTGHDVPMRQTCIIAVTGQGMTCPDITRRIAERIDAAARSAQTAVISDTCIVCVVDETDAENCARALHGLVTRRPDPA
ncbi:MAG: aspartate kinase [Candidatus Kapabacteria bacterium]|nr:aspartate kinase [Candidatus Kapabacteria bacterium]